MKIKIKKQFRLDELIKYVWDNHLYPETYKSNFNDFAHFDKAGKYQLIEQKGINQATKFTVEVEEELTNRTKLPDLVIVYNDNFIITDSDECISEYINDYDNESVSNRMYVPYKGGLKLVWSRKNGIPKHGTLELSE